MRRCSSERGTATMEVAIIAPFVLALLLLIMGFARYSLSENIVDQAARDGARAATAQKEKAQVDNVVNAAVTEAMQDAPASCRQTATTGDTPELTPTAFELPDLQNPLAIDSIKVTVRCTLALSDLVPVFLGEVELERTFTSPIDRYRSDR